LWSRGAWWSSGYRAGLPIERLQVKISARLYMYIWFEISAPSALISQVSYDEYTDQNCQWEVDIARERTGHPSSLRC